MRKSVTACSRSKSLQLITTWSRLQTTLAQITRIAPKWICTVPKIFHRSRFLSNLRLPWKNGVAQKYFTVLNALFTFRVFSILRLPWKTGGALNSQYWIYTFYYSGFLSNLRLPWENRVVWNFSLYWNTFYHLGFLSNLRLPWKTELPWNFSLCGMHFLHSEFFSNLRLPWKTELPKTFSRYWICIFYHSGCLIEMARAANSPVFGPSAKVLKQSACNLFSDDVIPGRYRPLQSARQKLLFFAKFHNLTTNIFCCCSLHFTVLPTCRFTCFHANQWTMLGINESNRHFHL